jgi:hypothetical protein
MRHSIGRPRACAPGHTRPASWASSARVDGPAAAIPGCRAIFYPWEGHLHFAHRLPEILAALGPS